MKKKTWRSFLSVLLVTATLLVTSCSSKPGESSSASSDSSSEVTASSVTTADETWDGTYPVTWKEGKVKLKYFLQLYSSAYSSAGDLYCWQQAEDLSGVEIEWIHPAAGSNVNDILNLALAGNNLPDIFSTSDSVGGGAEGLAKMGKLADITDLMDIYAPDYMKFVHEYPMMERSYKQSDGTVRAFKITCEDVKLPTDGLGVRYDWLEKLNMDPPTTINDWYVMLKAFKEANLDGVDGEVYPWTSESKSIAADSSHHYLFASAWGMRGKGLYLDPDIHKVTYLTRSNNYKAYVTEMNRWFSEGLIDPEFITSDSKTFHAKIQNGVSGAAHIFTSGTIGNDTAAAKANGKEDFWLQGVAYPIADGVTPPSGKGYGWFPETNTFNQPLGSNGTVISSDCKNIKAAVAFLNFPYTEKGLELFNYGVEGETFEWVNGERIFMDKILHNPEGKSPADACIPWCAPVIGGHRPMFAAASSQIRFPLPEQKASAEIWRAADNSILINEGPLKYNDDDLTKITSILNDIETYRQEMEIKIVMGIEPLSKLDEVIAQVEKMDIQTAIDIRQKAYDEYLAEYGS